ncbi:MAG: signal peptidase I [Bacilli bacterium]|nr:signal peptidase I [Bacilli bacterium]
MKEKNNDGKTFGDIFSSVSKEKDTVSFNNMNDETSNTDIKFDDVFESSKETEVIPEDKQTFGSIFDNASVNDENSTSSSIFDMALNDDEEKEQKVDDKKEISSSSIFDVATSEDSSNSSFSSIFDKIKEEEKVDNNNSKEEDIVEDKKIDNNIIFEDKEKDKEQEDIFENSKEENTISFDDKEEKDVDDKKIDNNIIFEDKEEDKKQEDHFEDNKKDNSIIFGDDKDGINEEEKDEVKVEDDKGLDNNVFFNDNKEEIKEEVVDSVEGKALDDNIFFSKDRNTDEDNKQEEVVNTDENIDTNNNIFFNNNIDNNAEDKVEKKEEKVVVEEDTKKDEEISPFFVEDVAEKDGEESNPFFNSKINLVEKPEYSNKNLANKIDLTNVQNFDVKIKKKKPSLVQSILGILSYALFIWLLLIGIALLVYVLDIKIRAAKGDNSPPKYGAYVVLTGSMLPEIQVYDVVVTKKIEAKDLNEDDIITFASSDSRFAGTIITHRIIKKNYNHKTKTYTFQTKGDNNNVADSALVVPENIYGKVVFKIPKLGYLRDFLASDGGWILVILLPCLAVVSYDIVKIGKSLKRKKYKNIEVQSR